MTTSDTNERTPVPAIEGWFTTDPDHPALVGTRCTACGSYFFPAEDRWCRNPACTSSELERVELSRRGTVWSFTNACYQPPPPYVPVTDPFEPFTLVAVELEAERLVVLGQTVDGVGVHDIAVGDEVELCLDVLFSDDEHDHLMWRWRPVSSNGNGERP